MDNNLIIEFKLLYKLVEFYKTQDIIFGLCMIIRKFCIHRSWSFNGFLSSDIGDELERSLLKEIYKTLNIEHFPDKTYFSGFSCQENDIDNWYRLRLKCIEDTIFRLELENFNENLVNNSQSMPPEFSEIIDKNFWDLF